jgi:hypothetical protein
MIIFSSHFEEAELQKDPNTNRQQIVIQHQGRKALVDTLSREVVTINARVSADEEE